MNLIRRVLGLSSDNHPAVPDDTSIVITRDDTHVDQPPAPVIEVPEERKQRKADSSGDSPAPAVSTVLSDDHTPILASQGVDLAGTRPLPPLETLVPRPGQRITFGQLSDIGMVRGNNQDAVFSFLSVSESNEDLPNFGLFVVADGMGGHHDGEKASAITVRMVARHVLDQVYSYVLDQKMEDPDRPAVADVLRDAVQKSNAAVTTAVPEGGTTVTAAVVLGDLAYLAHVGDSRAYLLTSEGIDQITRDHSLVQRLIELDQLTPEEAAEHPQRNVLYRAIGQSDHLDVDVLTRRLPPDARLLLCSDGLWNLVSEDVLLETAMKTVDPQQACSQLVHMANDRGGPDNITVILAKMPH